MINIVLALTFTLFAAARALLSAGSRIAISNAIIAITTRSSTSVKARVPRRANMGMTTSLVRSDVAIACDGGAISIASPEKTALTNASFVTREAFPNDVNFKSAAHEQTAKTRKPPQP